MSNLDNDALAGLRQQIDSIDKEIQRLVNERAKCAQGVAEVKLKAFIADTGSAENAEEGVAFYRPEREAQVLRKVIERNEGPLEGKAVAHIIREIMSACLALEKPMQVAFLGPEGTFTEAAAIKHFGHSVIASPQSTIGAVFAQVESGEANYGVVPVENSTEGMVTHTLDNFMESGLKICGEVELPIHLHLLVKEGVRAEQITKICAHQQALAQSRNWLDRHWPGVERVAVASNAKGARLASEETGVAAVAGDMTVELYGLTKLASNIQDYSNNTTRFLIIGREDVGVSGLDKTSVVVSVRNKPGALFQLLEPFHREGVMLTRIDTRPSHTETWAYVFFMEFEGHQHDETIAKVLAELEESSVMLKVLGSYPKAVL
jgi:chorismate mutase/prephenate dehydratase